MLYLEKRYPTVIDPDVREIPGLDDIVIDGWVPAVKGSRVKLVGFMKRGEQPYRLYEPVYCIHVPLRACERSIISTARAIERSCGWVN